MDISKLQEVADKNRFASQPKIQYPVYRLLGESGGIAEELAIAIQYDKSKLNNNRIESVKQKLANIIIASSMLATDLGLSLDDIIKQYIKSNKNV